MKNDIQKIIEMFPYDLVNDVRRHLGGLKIAISVREQSIHIEKSQFTACQNLNTVLRSPQGTERDKTIVGYAVLSEAVSNTIQSTLSKCTMSLLGSFSKVVFVNPEQLKKYTKDKVLFDALPKSERALRTVNAILGITSIPINPMSELEIDIYGMELIIPCRNTSMLVTKFVDIDSIRSPTDNLTIIARRARYLKATTRLHFATQNREKGA